MRGGTTVSPHAQGLVHLSEATGETSTRGLDTLEADCRQYRRGGARFAKWRAALRIGEGLPSEAAVQRNADDLAQYAAIAQVRTILALRLSYQPDSNVREDKIINGLLCIMLLFRYYIYVCQDVCC